MQYQINDVTEEMLNTIYAGNGLVFHSKGEALSYLYENGFIEIVSKSGKRPRIYKLREELTYKKDGKIAKRIQDYLVSFGGQPISGLKCKLSAVLD